jgi:hypothetical protein
VTIFLVGRRLGGPVLAVTAAALLASNAYHIAYSQEARSYTLVFVFAALSYGALVAMLEKPDWRTGVALGAMVAIAVHIHYWALVMFLGQVVAAATVLGVRRARWRDWLSLMTAMAVAGSAMLPWIGPLRRVAEMDTYWPARPSVLFFVDYFHTYFGGNLFLSVLAGALLLALPRLLRPGREADPDDRLPAVRPAAAVFASSVVVSLVVAYLRSVVVVPMLMPRFTFVLLPAVLLLVAIAVSRLRPPWLRAAVLCGLVVLSVAHLATSGYYDRPRKDQWREAARAVVDDPRFDVRSDRCLAMYAVGFQYYVDQWRPEVRVEEATTDTLRRILDEDPSPPVLWLLLAVGAQPPEEFRALQRERYDATDHRRFIKTEVERWEPRGRPAEPGEATASSAPDRPHGHPR